MLYKDFVKEKVNNEIRIKSAEGYPCEFERSKGRPLKDYKIYGESVQNGEPTPDNPIEIESVGEKTRNIWYPSVDALKSNGITCTRNNDNTYTVNGTATADCYFHIGKITIEAGTTYYLSGGTSQASIAFQLREGSAGVDTFGNYGGITTFSPTGDYSSVDIINCVIVVRSGVEVNNVIVKPMISLENTDEYEPYGKYKIPVTVRGKNLIKYPYSQTTKTENGVTFTDNGDGTITVNGTATDDTRFYCRSESDRVSISSGTYTISGCPDGGSRTTYYIGGFAYNVFSSGRTFSVTKTTSDWLYIMIKSGITVNNLIFKPQLELGAAATAYEQYREPITTHIYLDEPLRKIGDYADYIDFKNQKIVRQIKEITLNGSEMWNEYITYNGFWYKANDMKPQNKGYGYSNYYSYVTTPLDFGIRFGEDNNLVYFTQIYTPETPLTLNDWKAKLAEWNTGGNPLIVYYILAMPPEEPISLPTLKTVKGTNIMSVDTSILPSNIKTKYVRL